MPPVSRDHRVVEQNRALAPGELRRVLCEQAGLDLAALIPAGGGESASTFLATGRDGTVSVLKISPNATADAGGRLRELVAGTAARHGPRPRPWLAAARSAATERRPGCARRILATMLFYLYDRDDIRERLRGRALQLTDRHALDAYLAHMLLRQVDWSLRYHPGTQATAHHLRLARLVVADLA
jgi:hypothetical protein